MHGFYQLQVKQHIQNESEEQKSLLSLLILGNEKMMHVFAACQLAGPEKSHYLDPKFLPEQSFPEVRSLLIFLWQK